MNPLRPISLRTGSLVAIAAGLVLATTPETRAGCNCRRNASTSMAPVPMSMPMSQPWSGPPAMSGPSPWSAPYAPPNNPWPAHPVSRPPAMPSPPPVSWETNAPPGTLGRTYKLCSRPLPEDEHPRNAGLEIHLSEKVETIHVEKMEDGYVDEHGVWHFLTEKPLLPHSPPIVRVVLERERAGDVVRDVRVVRLIPGRILEVEF